MDEIKIDLNNCCMEVVSEESASIFSGFTSGSPEIDRYFREVAASDPRNVCYAFYNQKNGDVIGLAALCCSGINLDDAKLVELIPSIKIDYFAVSEKYQDIELSGSDDPE